MKRTLQSFVFLLCAGSASAQTPVISLSAPATVEPSGTYGSVRPRVAVAGVTPVVVWGKASTPGKIYTTHKMGSSFMMPVQVNPAGVDVYAGPSEGPNIAAKNDTVYVTFFSIPSSSSKVYTVRSTDAGMTFGDTVRADHQTVKTGYSPFIAISEGGDPYVAFEASMSNMSMPEQLICRSTDGGMSFMNEVNVNTPAPGEPCECCPPAIAMKDSLVFVMYRNNINNIRNIYVAVSQDHGATFPNVVQIDNTNYFINGCPTSGAEGVIAGDSLVVTWRSTVGGQTRIYYNAMHITSLQAGTVRKADPGFTGAGFMDHPSIAGQNDTIAIVWDDNRTGNSNCYMVASVDGGVTFSAPIMINDTAAQNGTQRTPHAAYSNGKFHIVYQNSLTGHVIYRTAQITGMLGASRPQPRAAIVTSAPNPFTHSTFIRFTHVSSKPEAIHLISSSGTVMKTYSGIDPSSIEIEKGSLPAGIYYAVVTFENNERSIVKLVMLD